MNVSWYEDYRNIMNMFSWEHLCQTYLEMYGGNTCSSYNIRSYRIYGAIHVNKY